MRGYGKGCRMITTSIQTSNREGWFIVSSNTRVSGHQIKQSSKALEQTRSCCSVACLANTRSSFLQGAVRAENFQMFKKWLLRFMGERNLSRAGLCQDGISGWENLCAAHCWRLGGWSGQDDRMGWCCSLPWVPAVCDCQASHCICLWSDMLLLLLCSLLHMFSRCGSYWF